MKADTQKEEEEKESASAPTLSTRELPKTKPNLAAQEKEKPDVERKKRVESMRWNCRFHPTDWWHEVGCPHMEWTREQLYDALLTHMEFEQKNEKQVAGIYIPTHQHVLETAAARPAQNSVAAQEASPTGKGESTSVSDTSTPLP